MNRKRSAVETTLNRKSEMEISMNHSSNQKMTGKFSPGLYMLLISVVIILMLSAIFTRISYADTVIVRPDGVVSSGSWGGVTAANLNDLSDATYAAIIGGLDTFSVSMLNDAAYSGATINSVTVWARASVVGGTGAAERITFGSAAPVVSTSGTLTLSDDPTRDDFSWLVAGLVTSGDVDGLEVAVNTTTLGAGEEVRIFEVWAVVDYTPLAAANELNACDSCHNQPPNEAATRNATGSGEIVGSHVKHGAYACTVCHPNNVVLNHRGGLGANGTEGQINMLANIQGGSYSLGSTGFLQDNEDGTGLGTCSDVSCHGGAGTTTPQWGGGAGLSCDGCHGAPPATNAHATHYTAKGWAAPDLTAANCTQCHPDNTAGHSDVTDGVVVINAGLSASGTSPALSCGTTANGCHNGKASPNWNTSGIACIDCHTVGGTNSATIANPVTGLHNITAATPTAHDNTLLGGCTECHTKASISGHWDGTASAATPDYTAVQVGITAMTGGAYTDAGGTAALRGTCATTCHSDGGAWSRQWSTAANSDATATADPRCAVCHGDFASDWRAGTSHEQTFGGAASTRGSGHNSGSGACEDCHSYPSVAGNHNTATHRINVNDPGTGITESVGRAWCSNCHSNDGAPTTSGTHTITQSVFPLLTVDGTNDPIGSCTGCHGTGGANYWPDGSSANVANDQPGEHAVHMQLLARRVYNETLAQIVTDTGTTADVKQKALCDYCHNATAQDATHNNGTANVFPSATYAKRYQDGLSDTGTLASYDGGASGTCSNVDCHNSKANLPGTYGWYDNGAADCDMCHTLGGHAEDFANPTSGLHNITPTVSGVKHGTVTACQTCHTAVPDNTVSQASAHINGTFIADSAANGDRYLFADYTDGTPGTCAGGNVGAGGCHAGVGDAGTWKRRWSTTAANSDGTECDNCHGGVNGEGTWTFGANNTVGDGSMSHDRNWDGVGALEVIGQHSADTGAADRCNICHVYNAVEYGTFGWGAGSNHGDGQIDMNSSLGYSRSGGSAYGCTTNCHTTGGSHLTETSGWTLGAIAGPGLSCTGCHTGSGGGALNVSSSSPHVITTRGGTFNACEDCHPGGSVGTRHSATGVIGIPNQTNVGINYVTGVNGYSGYAGIVLGGNVASGATEAETCWNCHDANNDNVLSGANEPSEWGTNTGSTYNYGTLNNKNWFSATWTSANFAFKNGSLTTGMGAKGASTHGTNGGAAGVDTAAKIGCSYCHDVHDTTGPSGKPFLRGSWIGSRYPEDGPPMSGTTYAGGSNKYSVSGKDAPPRTHAGANALGGWQIDANNGNPNAGVTFAQHAGLCSLCHGDNDAIEGETADRDNIQTLWSGHTNTIAGGSHNGTNNIFSNSTRNGTGNYATGMWMGAMNSTGYSGSWMHGMRNADGGNGLTTGNAKTLLVNGRALAYQQFAWTGVTVDAGTVNSSFHNFTCSKCHSPHASRLPKLMVTNCLDVRHNTWDNDFTGASNWATWQGYTRNNNKELAYASTAQNCHRYADMPAGGAVEEPGWNSVTPW